jgi:phenylacetic acid degradation operon negative regulatory protein
MYRGSVTPQSLMLSFLGLHVLDRDIAVYSGSVIGVFGRVGVSEEAVRSTLSRMTARGLLTKHRNGRKVYFGLTTRATQVLQDGERRIWQTGALNTDWDGTWTLIGFSLPESRRSDRHDLRSQLMWAGFGPVQNGLWIAPGSHDVTMMVEELGLAQHVTVFTASHAKPTEAADLAHRAFDTGAIAARYQEFLARWGGRTPLQALPDDLARQLVLHSDWLELVRQDPHLPAELLDREWPAIEAEQLFQSLARRYAETTMPLADAAIESITVV